MDQHLERWNLFCQKTCLFCPLLEFWVKLGRTLLSCVSFPLIFILGVFSQSGIRGRTQSGGRSMDYTEKQSPNVTDDKKISFSLNHSKANLSEKVSWPEAAKQWWHVYPTLRRFSSTKNSKINILLYTHFLGFLSQIISEYLLQEQKGWTLCSENIQI